MPMPDRARKAYRKKLLDVYIGWRKQGCSRCGFPDWRAIDAHHINASEKDSNIAPLIRSGMRRKLERELAKCVPLCRNCHAIQHFELASWGKGLSEGLLNPEMLPGFEV